MNQTIDQMKQWLDEEAADIHNKLRACYIVYAKQQYENTQYPHEKRFFWGGVLQNVKNGMTLDDAMSEEAQKYHPLEWYDRRGGVMKYWRVV